MAGVISASSHITAQIGAEVLDMGGNAIAAAVAACFATTIGEPSCASLAGGGLLLFYDGKSDKKSVIDFFGNAPGKGIQTNIKDLDFLPVKLNYGSAKQTFYIGKASAAVDGIIPGLCECATKWGNLPIEKIIEPTIDRLKKGSILPHKQYNIIKILEPVLTHTQLSSKYFAPKGKLLKFKQKYQNLDLAATLEKLTQNNWKNFYFHDFKKHILDHFGTTERGLITQKDLDSYAIHHFEPLVSTFSDAQIFFPPSPALGGEIISRGLSLLPSAIKKFKDPRKQLCFIMKVLEEIRFKFPNNFFSKDAYDWAKQRFHEMQQELLGDQDPIFSGKSCTTHISVADSWKNIVSVTITHGEGSGHMISNTGIMMNNLMGEKDLSPFGFFKQQPGTRLQTMMSPCIVQTKEGDIIALGTGGANRIRSALLQTLINLLHHKKSIKEAVLMPRLHFDHGTLFAELCDEYINDEEYLRHLGAKDTVLFPEKNFFFGGVNVVKYDKNGNLSGTADPRRGGVCIHVS